MTIEQILKEDFSQKFENELQSLQTNYNKELLTARKSRLLMSRYKYGSVMSNYSKGGIKAIPSCIKCINKYLETNNTEYLTDAINYIMFEYMVYPRYCSVEDISDPFLYENNFVVCLVNMLEKYKETRKTRELVNIATIIANEFTSPSFSDAYFLATPSAGSAGIVGISEKELKKYKEGND